MSATDLNDLWEALQDMHLRTLHQPALRDDPQFMARMERTHRRFVEAYERFLA